MSEKSLSFAIITPSYSLDFQRCLLLCKTIDQHCLIPVKHYIIVDRQDFKLFQPLQNQNREIITVESVLPWWIKKVSFLKNGWISFKTLPLRNWIIQQIVKLAIAEYVTEDVLVFVDSDVAFIRPFNLQNFVREGKDASPGCGASPKDSPVSGACVVRQIRLFCEPNAIDASTEPLAKWCEVGNKLLGLPPVTYPTANYLGNIITWKRDNVFKLYRHLEKVSGKSWIETIANSWHLSEYMLYGIFVDSILKETSQQYHDSQKICHDYWQNYPMSPEELKDFLAKIPSEHIAVMISAKSGMNPQDYAPLLKDS